ncbi:MAG: PAS domain S-box protein [Nitrospirota bacterium]
MKKKIVIGLGVFSFLFLFGGIYIIVTIESATSTLNNLITLHQVEILREQLLLQIKRVQADINLKNTRYARGIDTVIANVRNMERLAESCLDCHHSADMTLRLEQMQAEVHDYKKAISRLFTIRANVQRLEEEEDMTFRIGEELITSVNNMITIASSKLESKTQASLREISKTKAVLYGLVAVLPLFTGILGYVFIRGFTRPVKVMLKAIREIKDGNLDHKIVGLRDEFGELADSFNEMSHSLSESMLKIRENEKRYRMLFEGAGDAIFMLEAAGEDAGRIVSANRSAAAMHGYTMDEILQLNLIRDIDSPDDAKGAPERIKRIMNGEWIKAEIYHRKKDGTSFPVEISAGLLEFMGHKYILAIDRDITERKRSEEAIIRSYIMFVTVLNSIEAVIYVADMTTYEVLYINNYARKIFGDLEGRICWQTLQAGQNGPCAFCTNDKLLRPDGSPAGVYSWELQNTVDGRWYEIRDSAIEWIDGRIVRLEIANDITERKKIEETLKRAEQMKLVGEWAAGLAHEIKNSLAGIKISVEVLGAEANMPDEDKETIIRAVKEIKRIEMLLKSLLSFAKPPKLQLHAADVNEILEKTIDFSLKQSYLKPEDMQIEVVKDLDKNIPRTLADTQQMQQVFTNLLLNARDAMKGGGILTARSYYNAQDNMIHIEISDTGEGVDEALLDKIFQPFVTTKSKGTGLGLAISKRIIEQHGGTISAGNKPGGGGIFYINLPVRHE